MSTFLSVFGGNARTSEEDNQYNIYNVYNQVCPLNGLNAIRIS